MIEADVDGAGEIDREAFPTTRPPIPFRYEITSNRLARYLVAVDRRPQQPGENAGRLTRIIRDVRDLVTTPSVEESEIVCGYVAIWLMVDQAHISSIAVRESHRRRGIGELLIIGTIELAHALNENIVTLECRVSNYPAIALYEKYGFSRKGVRPRYYSDNMEDAFIMSTESILTSEYRQFFEERKRAYAERHGEPEIELPKSAGQ
jgi:ribosomal-protein-alanine N-acetyltransferase